MEDSSAANITETNTVQLVQNSTMYNEIVHTEGTTEENLQVPTVTEVPSPNTVINTDTELKNGTNFESTGQVLQTKDEMVVDRTSDLTEKQI